ncbi:ABC transporter ATP-binding protein [Tenacibaculum finnmarkense]|uniref:ABC transporter ATP-binding protein n=1 Tax=Tenacibaculum finnmarkense TaxID=2781243 RepID=UPI000C45463D|nr:ABC transporter ATP-binding protein [Tenacibaculum finnmarkense]MCD8440490.1 ABC transporter ATP-binding protein [Tenacibaculum finnmarkense genomovar ulcerans]MCG8721608.1 ABC transporter ATP-binding protein [Tenacibaculum finnmarkense]SOS55226.1 Glutathione import ATP-binding protein GsiA [Tenacibaculum finnmarkense]
MLQVKNLEISFKNAPSVIQEVSFNVQQTQILGIVGESGSGKSITSLAILGLLPKYATITGEILFKEQNVLNYKNSDFQKIRGSQIAMIFQEPMSSLNPTLTCGFQVAEVLELHTNLSKKEIKQAVILLFEKVKLPRPNAIFNAYPHQISGGQKQRVIIAMAIACKPQLLIADEPTTALDVTVQKEIIALLKELQQEYKMGIIFISHDLGLVSEIADTVVVMRKGKVVEQGATKELFLHPKENYTKALIKSKPTLKKRFKILPTVIDFIKNTVKTEVYTDEERKVFHQKIYAKTPLLEIKNLHKEFISKASWFSKASSVKAVNNVSFKIYEGETIGLVGESGCGKTTLGRTILQLENATSGQIIYKGEDITKLSKKSFKKLRKEIQIIFQDPFSSLNPRITVGNAIIEPMKVHNILNSLKERKEYVFNLLEKVGLEKAHFYRYPHEFSGGQRQRIGIARTIALQPKLIICDESVSALDVSVQAQVLNLLNELKAEFNFTYLFISHDLSVVKYMSDQLVVMNKGQIEEIADADEIYNNPKTSYTKTLIAAIPKGL